VTVEDLVAQSEQRGSEGSLFAPPADGRPDGDAPADDGPPTQAYDVLGEPPTRDVPPVRSPLGEPDDDEDAAMRAFFEEDKAAEAPKGRFLRRK
jgi:hypothetical protein